MMFITDYRTERHQGGRRTVIQIYQPDTDGPIDFLIFARATNCILQSLQDYITLYIPYLRLHYCVAVFY